MVSTHGRSWRTNLSKPNRKINYTSNIWFQDIIDFFNKHNIKTFTKEFFEITSQRTNDKCIKVEILKLNLSQTSLIKINACWIYLQVFHLSEMIETNGKLFRTEFITGEKLTKTTSRSRWPNQIKPSPSAWKLCKKIIQSTFKLTPNFILLIELRLSNWIVSLDERQMKHEWYFSSDSTEIYHRVFKNIEIIFATCIDKNNYEANED